MRPEKELLLNEIQEKIEASQAMVVATYDRLEPNRSWDLRGQLAQTGSLFEVVRKRVFLKAAERSGIKFDPDVLRGHVGVLFISQTDAIAPLKTLCKFSADNPQTLEVLCGRIEGRHCSGADMKELALLPGQDQMRAEFIALLVAPMSGLAATLEAILAGPLSVIEQKATKE
jgi:large subunit ribosomal protein L10